MTDIYSNIHSVRRSDMYLEIQCIYIIYMYYIIILYIYILTNILTCPLTFLLTYTLTCTVVWHIFWRILTFFLAYGLTYLTLILANFMWHKLRHVFWHIFQHFAPASYMICIYLYIYGIYIYTYITPDNNLHKAWSPGSKVGISWWWDLWGRRVGLFCFWCEKHGHVITIWILPNVSKCHICQNLPYKSIS